MRPSLAVRCVVPALSLLLGLFLAAPAARANATPSQVLVVVNDSSPVSQAVGSWYAAARSIPAVNVFHLPAGTPTTESITRTQYNQLIRDPIMTYLSVTQPQLKDQILYIALTKSVPLRVTGTNNASVDSELCMMFTGLVGDNGQASWITNPYFNKNIAFSLYAQLSPQYLVCRLDGFEDNPDPGTGIPADVLGLMTRALSPATSGKWLLDQDPSKTGGYSAGNMWMTNANTHLNLVGLGANVVFDTTTTFMSNVPGILGYASWGSNDAFTAGPPYYGQIPAGTGPVYPGTFASGAIMTDYVSTNGRTFLKAGQVYGQSMIADLIHLGVSGASGYVDEPFLTACAHPDILFARYLAGYDAAEAYYMAIATLSWQNIVVVDPLMTSGIIARPPPSVTAVVPDRGDSSGGTAVVVTGANLGAIGDPLTVLLDGVPVPGASFFASNIVTFSSPPHEPGPVDVTLTVFNGTTTRVNGFVYLPALILGGSASIGNNASLEIAGHSGESYLVYLGSGTGSVPAPPYGTFLLDPNGYLLMLFAGAFTAPPDRATVTMPIPPDAGLIGFTAHFQAIVGPLTPGNPANHFTNRASLSIQP